VVCISEERGRLGHLGGNLNDLRFENIGGQQKRAGRQSGAKPTINALAAWCGQGRAVTAAKLARSPRAGVGFPIHSKERLGLVMN